MDVMQIGELIDELFIDSKFQKQQQGWPKTANTARKYNKDENLENNDSEVLM